jgi:hypothetical protein
MVSAGDPTEKNNQTTNRKTKTTNANDAVQFRRFHMKKAEAIRPEQANNGPTRTYGWKPDIPDHRDLLYGSVRRAPATLPEKV